MTDFEHLMARLNPEQLDAVSQDRDTVVLAGPGSGKTDTTVLKVARLLHRDVPAPRGVACITYGNDAVREFTVRFRDLGLHAGRRLFLGTVHSFCLNRILRPFAAVAGETGLANPRVLSPSEQRGAMQTALDAARASDNPQYFDPTLTRIRRAIALNETLAPFDERHIEVAHTYESMLIAEQCVDFEAMTLSALRIIESNPSVRELIVARYPWLAIDEYQDLGGPLHRIVLALQAAGTRIFAVGDPDQCIFGFTGANPAYLNELVEHPDFRTIRLRFNYRSGARLIAAAEAPLETTRNYQPDPSRIDEGEIIFHEIGHGLTGQAKHVVHELVPQLIKQGVEPHEIAILYKGKGDLSDALVAEAADAPQEYLVEKDARFPTTPIVRWLQRCATRALGGIDADRLAELITTYRHHLARSGRHDDELATRCRFFNALQHAEPDQAVHDWSASFDDALELTALLAADGTVPDELDALRSLRHCPHDPVPLLDFAHGVQVHGRVVITTCHASKGRQFDVVILPGLQTSLFPFARWQGGSYRAAPVSLAEDRRLFYVGLTRARQQVHLVYSPQFTNKWGHDVRGRSMFVDEVAARLANPG